MHTAGSDDIPAYLGCRSERKMPKPPAAETAKPEQLAPLSFVDSCARPWSAKTNHPLLIICGKPKRFSS
jgi:hypothetical protein